MSARHKEGYFRKNGIHTFSCVQRKVYRSTTSGCRGTPYFQEIRPGAGFETADLVKEKLGGAGLPLNDSEAFSEWRSSLPTKSSDYYYLYIFVVPSVYFFDFLGNKTFGSNGIFFTCLSPKPFVGYGIELIK